MKSIKFFFGLYIVFLMGCDSYRYRQRPSVTIDFNRAVINSDDAAYFIDSISIEQYNKTFLSAKRVFLDINNLNASVDLHNVDTVLFRVSGSLKEACKYSNLYMHVFLRNMNLSVPEIDYAGAYYLYNIDSSITKLVEGKL